MRKEEYIPETKLSFFKDDVNVGEYSRHGPRVEQNTFDDVNKRTLSKPIREDAKGPEYYKYCSAENASARFENFTEHKVDGERTDALCYWAKAKVTTRPLAQAFNPPVDVLIDRSTLTSIAMTPYNSKDQCGWRVAAKMIDGALVVVPCRQKEQDEFFLQKKFVELNFFRNKFIRMLTGGYNGEDIDANESYHLVRYGELRCGRGCINVMYSCQVEAVSSETNKPVEVRLERSHVDWSRDDWWHKALRWYLQARLAGAEHIIDGELLDDVLTGKIAQVPVAWLSAMASKENRWGADKCFAYAQDVLSKLRFVYRKWQPDNFIIASWTPKSGQTVLIEESQPGEVFPARDDFMDCFDRPLHTEASY